MSRAYSADLRERVLAAVAAGQSARGAAARFGIGPATGIRWVRRWREAGERTARKQGHPPGSKLEAHVPYLLGQTCQCTIDHGKIHIHARLYQLRTHHTCRFAGKQAPLHVADDARTMLATHGGRQVNCSFGHVPVQFACVGTRVDHCQDTRMLLNLPRDPRSVSSQMEILGPCHGDALQVVIQRIRVADDFADIIKTTQGALKTSQSA